MPQELLDFPPAYCIVGAYRLWNDKTVWKPMWDKTSHAAKRAGLIAALWGILTWPIQKFFVRVFMSGWASVTGMSSLYHKVVATADQVDDPLPFNIPLPSLTTFAAMMFVLSQCNTIMDFWLRRRLRECRNDAYSATVRSRGKPTEWWTRYFEEWEEPPFAKASKNAKKAPLYIRLANPLFRMFVLRFLLLPLDFVPFLSLFISAYLRSLSMGRQLHVPLFVSKRMTATEVELWLTERQWSYRAFGMSASLLEALPIVGLVFSISNRVGAAMFAHDLEKRQQRFRTGELRPLGRDETYSLTNPFRPSSPTSSQKGKLPFAPQGEDEFQIPGATMGSGGGKGGGLGHSGAGSGSAVPPDEDPPAYTEEDARNATGDSSASVQPRAATGLQKRRVPPPPVPKR